MIGLGFGKKEMKNMAQVTTFEDHFEDHLDQVAGHQLQSRRSSVMEDKSCRNSFVEEQVVGNIFSLS